MKELTIKEKASRYDEAIEKAKSKIKNDKDHVLYEEKQVEYLCQTLQMAIKRLREVHNIDIVIDAAFGMLGVKVYVPFISTYKPRKDNPSKVRQIKIYYKDDKGVIPALQDFDSYEEAAEAAIKYCLENLI